MNTSFVPINAFQADEFRRLGLQRRDPMFLTMATLLEIDSFPSAASIGRHASTMRPDEELRRTQWLFEGMSPAEVDEAYRTPRQRTGMFKTAEERQALRKARIAEDRDAQPKGEISARF